MTNPTLKKSPKAGRWSRLAAAAAAVGMSIGIANGMALAVNGETAPLIETPPALIQRVVISESQAIVVVIPRTIEPGSPVGSPPIATTTNATPPAPVPVAVKAPAPTPVTESSGS